METEKFKTIKNTDPHFETPLTFAKWRINELKKPQQAGIVNETIASIIELVNGILGQYNRDIGEIEGNRQTLFQKFDNDGVLNILSEEFKKTWLGPSILRSLGVSILIFIGGVIALFFSLIRWVVGIFTSSFIQTDGSIKSAGKIGKVIVPFIIYITLIVVTVGSEIHRGYNFNIYRLLSLLVLYIISYNELKYVWFMLIFVLSIIVETWFIIQKNVRVES